MVDNNFTEEVTFILGLVGCIRVYQATKNIPTEKKNSMK